MKNKFFSITIMIAALMVLISACNKKEYLPEIQTQSLISINRQSYKPLQPVAHFNSDLGRCVDIVKECLPEVVVTPNNNVMRDQYNKYNAFISDVIAGNKSNVARCFYDGSYLEFMPQLEDKMVAELSSGKYYFHHIFNKKTGINYVIASTEQKYCRDIPIFTVFQFKVED